MDTKARTDALTPAECIAEHDREQRRGLMLVAGMTCIPVLLVALFVLLAGG
jgi:hypothetical protein